MGLAGMAPQGMAPVQGQVTGISYPAPRGVAPGGFLPNILQQQQAAMSVMGNVQTSQQGPGPGQPSQRAFSGTVTKLHDNFGFVDDDVFFQHRSARARFQESMTGSLWRLPSIPIC